MIWGGFSYKNFDFYKLFNIFAEAILHTSALFLAPTC